MRAFWLMCKNQYVITPEGDAVNRPDIPDVGDRVNPLRLFIVDGQGHKHTLVGGHTMRDANIKADPEGDHNHIIIQYGANRNWLQRIMPESYDTGDGGHQHDLSLVNNLITPDWYLIFWKGTDIESDQVLAHAGVQWLVDALISQVEVPGDPPTYRDEIGDLINVPWDATEQAQKQAQFLSVLGMDLHSDINSGKRLVEYFCGSFLAVAGQHEKILRFTEY